jgi:hypothetical protein
MTTPKFKVGDIIIHKNKLYNSIYEIIEVNNIYKVQRIHYNSKTKQVGEKFLFFLETIDKLYELFKEPTSVPQVQQTTCTHPRKYHNKVLTNFMIWVCPDCKQEV